MTVEKKTRKMDERWKRRGRDVRSKHAVQRCSSVGEEGKERKEKGV